MTKYDDHKFCFIISTNQERYLQECLLYLSLLDIPNGYEMETLTVTEAPSIAHAYNEGMASSDARYKIYLHQDVFITEKFFLHHLLKIFKTDTNIGMIGMVGTPQLSQDGVMWHEERRGDLYMLDQISKECDADLLRPESDFCEVEVIDGLLMATCIDIPWREDLLKGWDFYDVSQSLEFRRAGYKIVVPYQNPSWTIHACGIISLWNYDKNRQIILKSYPEIQKDPHKLRILFVNSDIISLIGIPSELKQMGHSVSISRYKVHLETYVQEDEENIVEILEEGHYDLVVSYDFSSSIASACHTLNIKYLAWVYDAPQLDTYSPQALLPNVYIYTFDKKEAQRLKRFGIAHVICQPLATEVYNFGGNVITPKDEKRFQTEISFVGKMYDKRGFEEIFQNNQPFLTEALQTIDQIKGQWNDKTRIFHLASDELINFMISQTDCQIWEQFQIDKRYFCESLRLARKANELERTLILNHLAEKYEVTLFTEKRKYPALKNVHIRPWVDYLAEMPKVFHLSKINLNITSRSIESGIPQRVFDVLAVGGFMLTNYQPELEDYFVIGEDLEVYHNLEELDQKVEYYLTHEQERIRIGINGYKKVRQNHSYQKRFETILAQIFDTSSL